MLDLQPRAIHFSGHGILAKDIKAELIKFKDTTMMTPDEIDHIYQLGDALVVEDGNCTAKYLHSEQLKAHIE